MALVAKKREMKRADGQQPEPALSHHRHHLRGDGLRPPGSGTISNSCCDGLLRQRLAAEIAGQRAQEDAEGKERQHERVGHRPGHGEAAVGEQRVEGLGDALELPK